MPNAGRVDSVVLAVPNDLSRDALHSQLSPVTAQLDNGLAG